MRIAVVQHVYAGFYQEYISSLLDEEALKLNYQIKTWSNSVPAFSQLISVNAVVYILIESSARFTLKWWYSVKLPAILKKMKADIVFDLNGKGSSLKIPQLVALSQLISKKEKAVNKAKTRITNDLQQAIKNSKYAVVYSTNKAKELMKDEATINNLQVIRFTAPDNFRKFEWHEKIMPKAMQADNNEYFLAILNDDAEDDFTMLLRAFSKFKKWQQSSMKIILLPKSEVFEEKIHVKLKTYRYREDVKLLENLEETQLVSVIASAHSLIHITSSYADLMVLSIALKCALPVITYKNPDIEEYLDKAAYYIKDLSDDCLGDGLIGLYKDENLHAQLKEAAEKQSLLFKREEYKSNLWQLLETAAHL